MKNSGAGRPILVAVRTPTRSAGPLLRKAAAVAKLYGAPLRLVHVLAIPQGALSRAGATVRQAAQADLRMRSAELAKLAKLPALRGLQVTTSVRCDYPVQDALVREVLERRPRMLIAESRRQGRLARLLLTNVDWELIRNCPCPLWLSKTERFDRSAPVIAAVDPLHAHGKPAQLDDLIVARAAEIAGAPRKVTVCHAYELPRRSAADTPLEAYWIGVSEEERRSYEAKLRQAADRLLRSRDIPEANLMVVRGDPALQLPRLAKKHSAALVVMGAISRRGLERVFIGNTAERAIDEIGCDVLVIKPRGFKSPLDHRPVRSPRRRPRVEGSKPRQSPIRGDASRVLQ